MGENVILEELNYIIEQINECLKFMEEISQPRVGTVFWRLFFPAGQFSQAKSAAKAAAAILNLIDKRLDEMANTLQKNYHPFAPSIYNLRNFKLDEMAGKLIEIPEREQYIRPQIENLRDQIEEYIRDFQR